MKIKTVNQLQMDRSAYISIIKYQWFCPCKNNNLEKNSDLSLHCWTERFKHVIQFGWYFRSITRGIVSQVAINVTVSRPPPLQLHKIHSSQEILFPMMSCGMTSQVFLFVQTTYTWLFSYTGTECSNKLYLKIRILQVFVKKFRQIM